MAYYFADRRTDLETDLNGMAQGKGLTDKSYERVSAHIADALLEDDWSSLIRAEGLLHRVISSRRESRPAGIEDIAYFHALKHVVMRGLQRQPDHEVEPGGLGHRVLYAIEQYPGIPTLNLGTQLNLGDREIIRVREMLHGHGFIEVDGQAPHDSLSLSREGLRCLQDLWR
jgi:hypothetical protein